MQIRRRVNPIGETSSFSLQQPRGTSRWRIGTSYRYYYVHQQHQAFHSSAMILLSWKTLHVRPGKWEQLGKWEASDPRLLSWMIQNLSLVTILITRAIMTHKWMAFKTQFCIRRLIFNGKIAGRVSATLLFHTLHLFLRMPHLKEWIRVLYDAISGRSRLATEVIGWFWATEKPWVGSMLLG
ncbi:hypothetical protein BDV18DRAFT_148336 [Aspergillus unguis]